jgi:hypothetical protein
MQKVIDYLETHGYSNINRWVQALDEQVEKILVKRLVFIIQQWGEALDYDYSKVTPRHRRASLHCRGVVLIAAPPSYSKWLNWTRRK